jgi:hypothetical protein
VIDYPSWQGYTSVEHVSGPVGGEGEIVLIEKVESELVWQPKYCRTLKLDPPRQVVWKIYPGRLGDGGWELDFSGTVEYRFEEVGPSETLVDFQVIKEFVVPVDDAAELDEVRAREYRLQADVMAANHPRLVAVLGR